MKRMTIFFAWLLTVCLSSALAAADVTAPIHVEWSYSGSAVAYNLYQDGAKVCTSSVPSAISMDCTVTIGTNPVTFTLTAVDASGVESPQSAPYLLTPPPIDAATGTFLPQASFTASVTSGGAPLPVSFDASASSALGGTIVSYNWDFGDGQTGSGKLIDHTFAGAGTYAVTLSVVDDANVSAKTSTTITVSAPAPSPNAPPVAVITATQTQTVGAQVAFDASKSTDASGTITSYAWDFGDGVTATGVSVTHDFAAAGDYTVVLTVTDDKGATAQDKLLVTVVDPPKPANVPPVAEISASTAKSTLHFAWDYTGNDPGLAGFKLYQNGRLACTVNDQTLRQYDCQTYVDDAKVQLWVTSFDQTGQESAHSNPTSYDNTGLFPPAAGEAPLSVHFTPGASNDPDGTLAAYAWDFGDGAAASGPEVDHVFALPGSYTVTLTVTDNAGAKTQATTVIKVSDHPPVASGVSFTTLQDQSLTATLSASSATSSPLTFQVVKNGTLGTATITDAARGLMTYVPNPGAYGSDTFTFKVNDGTLDSNEATVSVTVQKKNTPPVAAGQSVSGPANTAITGTLKATDADNDPLTYILVTPPAHGGVVLGGASPAAFIYTPAANYSGADSFTFKANDGKADSSPATVAVTVAPLAKITPVTPVPQQVSGVASAPVTVQKKNTPPVAAGQLVSGKANTAITGTLKATDADNDHLTYILVTRPAHGGVVLGGASPAAFIYTPTANYSGADSFIFKANDGKADSSPATVAVTVAVPALLQAQGSSLSLNQGTVAAGKLAVSGASGVLRYSIVINGTKGRAIITNAATGAFVYRPALYKTGTDSFVYQVSDGKSTAKATVAVTIVAVNHPPRAANRSLSTRVNTKLSGKLYGYDLDGDALTFSTVTTGTLGSVVITNPATGDFTYTPLPNKTGIDRFIYQVSDGKLTAKATVTIVIR